MKFGLCLGLFVGACLARSLWATEAWESHWAFQKVARPEVPLAQVDDHARLHSPIDAFLQRRLQTVSLELAPTADRSSWFRRIHWALIGLPPSPEDAQAFAVAPSLEVNGRERWIDRLLASPAYGERRAQMWLDLARFAESDGFEFDHERKQAWRYRDWVIDAFNRDVPYDDFVALQLAGDEMRPGDERAAEATGFLLAGPDMVDINLPEERRHNALSEMTAAVGSVFLGLTVGCAQCHDHRSDPISLKDYYAFQAFFANTVIDPKRNKQLGHRVREPGPEVPDMRIKVRGDFRRLGAPVQPALLRPIAQGGLPEKEREGGERRSSHRRERLARALVDPRNPLVARVMVNRLWQEVIGKGLVESPSDFGALGTRPTHPALLDWMATELVSRQWAMKPFLRLLLTSQAFQQASFGRRARWEDARATDPDNRLYWRAHRKRLSGELIRDSLLAATGGLNRTMGGPGVRPPLPPEVTSTLLKNQWNVTPDEGEHVRRSVYLFVRRNLRFPLFDVFDKPDPNATCARRNTSTTAPQSLTLLNSGFSESVVAQLATGVQDLADGAAIEALYWTLFGRSVTKTERERGLRFLQGKPKAEGRADYCLALINTNEAVYVD